MAKQSFKSKAINAVLAAVVRALFGWAEEWGEDAFFFIVFGDKRCTDVAWYNTRSLGKNGAEAVASNPLVAAVCKSFDAYCSYELKQRFAKDPKFKREFDVKFADVTVAPSEEDNGWYSWGLDPNCTEPEPMETKSENLSQTISNNTQV